MSTNWDKLFATLDKDEQNDIAEVLAELKEEIDSKDAQPEVVAALEPPAEAPVKRKGRGKGSTLKVVPSVAPEPEKRPVMGIPEPTKEAEQAVDPDRLFHYCVDSALKAKAIDLDEYLEVASASFAKVVVSKLIDSFKAEIEKAYKQAKEKTDELPF